MSDQVVRKEAIKAERINVAGLDETMRAFFGARCTGITLAHGQLIIHLTDDEPGDEAEIERMVGDHDPDVPSQREQREMRLWAFKQKAERGEAISPKELADAVADLTALKSE